MDHEPRLMQHLLAFLEANPNTGRADQELEKIIDSVLSLIQLLAQRREQRLPEQIQSAD